jgi:hypothetical protein
MNVKDDSGELEEFAAYYRLAKKLISAASKEQVAEVAPPNERGGNR